MRELSKVGEMHDLTLFSSALQGLKMSEYRDSQGDGPVAGKASILDCALTSCFLCFRSFEVSILRTVALARLLHMI